MSETPVLVRVEPSPPFNGAAIFAFVLGLLALLNAWLVWAAWLLALPGLLIGILAIRSIGRSGARGGALAGVGVAFSFITLAVAVVFFGFAWFAKTFG
jgi:hypothetical protein